LVDEETGEVFELKQSPIMEVLSRRARSGSAYKFKRGAARRGRQLKIRLKSASSPERIMQRAKRLAMRTLKKRFAKKSISKMSVGDKERVERILHTSQYQNVIARMARTLGNKVRKTEANRIHKQAANASPNAKHNIKKKKK
jgi:hypothetical protein